MCVILLTDPIQDPARGFFVIVFIQQILNVIDHQTSLLYGNSNLLLQSISSRANAICMHVSLTIKQTSRSLGGRLTVSLANHYNYHVSTTGRCETGRNNFRWFSSCAKVQHVGDMKISLST